MQDSPKQQYADSQSYRSADSVYNSGQKHISPDKAYVQAVVPDGQVSALFRRLKDIHFGGERGGQCVNLVQCEAGRRVVALRGGV